MYSLRLTVQIFYKGIVVRNLTIIYCNIENVYDDENDIFVLHDMPHKSIIELRTCLIKFGILLCHHKQYFVMYYDIYRSNK